MKRLQMAGNKPIALIGGGTAWLVIRPEEVICVR